MSISEQEQARRASFGRGIIEGLRMAGITNTGEYMNANKMARVESGLSTIAKKVLDAVPIQESWDKSKIYGELRRHGCVATREVADGCLNTLKDAGLVKEPARGFFIRVVARTPAPKVAAAPEIEAPAIAEPAPSSNTTKTEAMPQSATSANSDTLSRLANLGALLRSAAEECDAIALDVEARVQSASKDGEKLRQLSALLRDIGT